MRTPTKRKKSRKHWSAWGYVYLMSMGQGLVKIGRAVSVEARLREFEVANPLLTIIYSKAVSDARAIESALHRKWRAKRFKGEWYSLTSSDVKEITAYLDRLPDAPMPGLVGALMRLHASRAANVGS